MMKLASFITTGVACLLALCFAAISAAYWLNELSGQSDLIRSVAVIGSVCISLMGMVAAFNIKRNFLLIVPVLIFIGCDVYQNAQGYETFKGFTVSADVTAAKTRLEQARADLASLPLPSATGEIRQVSTWETLNTKLTKRVEKADSDLKALSAPSAPLELVLAVMAAIQLALAIYFACIGKGKETKAPKPRTKPKNKAASERAKKGWETRRSKNIQPLKLVASNDH